MKKASLKTSPTNKSIRGYIDSILDNERKEDCESLIKIMKKVTKEEPVMWGDNIIGFGNVELTYASGRRLDWFKIGFASRKNAISLYLTCDLDKYKSDLEKLGKHKRGKGCLYVKKLDDVDLGVLKELITKSSF